MEDTELAQEIRAIKHEFMAFRNGIVSDTLRKAGMDCYKVIRTKPSPIGRNSTPAQQHKRAGRSALV